MTQNKAKAALERYKAGLTTQMECIDSLDVVGVRGGMEWTKSGELRFIGYDYDKQEWLELIV